MDTKRFIVFVVLSFTILMFWGQWQSSRAPQVTQAKTESSSSNKPAQAIPTSFNLVKDKRIHVSTDLMSAEIDLAGGDLRSVELLKHKSAENIQDNLVLLSDSDSSRVYISQSGLIGEALPNHKTIYQADSTEYQLNPDQNELKVVLIYQNEVVKVAKTYTFKRGDYAVNVDYQVSNISDKPLNPWVYFQILHDNQSDQGAKMMPTFTGGAYYNADANYKKVSFKDMAKADLNLSSNDGWVGLVQHYFVSAWIPQQVTKQEFYTSKISDSIYAIGTKYALGDIAPGASKQASAKFYSGPQLHDELAKTAPGLEYTVDYGWLTFIASPLFKLLSLINDFAANWGVSIIILTLIIKTLFYPLSAAGYRNMAQMRELAPRLQSMKEKYGDDKLKMQQAMMELYKTEKINPFGGCLPILVQIPVFISLYWMLLGSVEMRHAPFMLWIQDLSAPDPYYVLPILMAISMFVQTKLNPKPTDPMQAKMMLFMPLIFSVFFFFFPAGLVLYWLVNNILSIVQQAQITRSIHAMALAKKKGNVNS